MEIDPPEFSSKDEEIQYWMDLAHEMHQRKEETEQDFEDFQANSQSLEKELEASLEQAEKTNRELRNRNIRLATEVEQLRTRLDQTTADCTVFQNQSQEFQSQNEQLIKYIRQLEQTNDDLERAHRVSRVTAEEIEGKFNSAIEKNALLESELDEKESLRVTVQRLMDEIRDLKQEIHVQVRHQPDNDKSADRIRSLIDSNKLQVELEGRPPTNNIPQIQLSTNAASAPIKNEWQTPTSNNTTMAPIKIGNGNVTGVMENNNNVPMAPCTRILAMNMIGDLMRKVGALEDKLNSCRNAFREDQAVRDPCRNRRELRGLTSINNNHVRP